MDDFLLIKLTIPLTDQSLEMNLYKVYNLPALHPKLKVEFTYELEGVYWLSPKTNCMLLCPWPEKLESVKALKDIYA